MLPFSESLIIIPTYNEIDNIQKMIDIIFDLYPEVNLLIIDDGSPDGTADIVKKSQEDKKQLHLIQRTGKLGYKKQFLILGPPF